MYGFHEAAERVQVEQAARDFLEHISQKTAGSPLERMKTYMADLLENGTEEKRKSFYDKLNELHKNLLYDGTELQQRPFDLLCSTASANKDELFSLLQSWELLTIAFRLLEKKPESGEEWNAALQAVQAAVARYEKQQLPMRKGLDVYDHQISYYERMARNRNVALPEEKKVVIPRELYSRFRSAKENSGWMDAVLFCVMACRYLRALGVTKERLQKEDYWLLPGGKSGFGIYQDRKTAGTFFDRVMRFLKPENWEKPPAKVITYNNLLMLWIDPEIFGCCETAAKPEKPGNGQTAGVTVDAEGNLFVDDDGTRKTTELIYQALEQYDALEEEKASTSLEKQFLRQTGNQVLWKKAAESTGSMEWKKRLDAFLVGLDQELTSDENKKQKVSKADVKIMGSSKGAEKNAPRLLIGYLLFQQEGRTWSGTGEELWGALSEKIASDADGTQYGSYWTYLDEAPRELTAAKKDKTYAFALGDKASVAKKPEDEKVLALRDKLLTEDGNPTVTAEDFKSLEALFELSVGAIDGSCKLALDTALKRHQKRNRRVELQKIFLLVMQWKQKKACSFTIKDDGVYLKNPETKLQPFGTKEDAQSFLAFLTKLKEGEIHTALSVKKTEAGYSAAFIEVFPQLSDGEIAVLEAWEIGKDEKPSEEEYRQRLGGIDLQALNSLLEKASLRPERELPEKLHTGKLLDGRPKIKNRLGGMLLLALLFRMYESRQELTVAGEIQTDTRIFCFDRDSLSKLREYLLKLWALRGTRGKTYGVEVTRPEGQDEGFTLKICEQS